MNQNPAMISYSPFYPRSFCPPSFLYVTTWPVSAPFNRRKLSSGMSSQGQFNFPAQDGPVSTPDRPHSEPVYFALRTPLPQA